MGDSNNTLTVSTELGDVVVHKMPLSDYAELLRALEKVPTVFQNFLKTKNKDELKKYTNVELVMALPTLLADSWSDIVGLLAVPTDKDGEFLGKLDAADAIDIIDAILELNDFARIMAAVKKMQARIAKVAQSKAPTA